MSGLHPKTVTELQLRHAELADQAQGARDRSAVVNPAGLAALTYSREARQAQARADDYARLLAGLGQPTLEQMEDDASAALEGALRGGEAHMLEPGITRAMALMGTLFDNWRSRSHG